MTGEFAGQFVLAREADAIPPGWGTRTVGPWRLGAHPALPVVEIGRGGARPALLLGHAVDVDVPAVVRSDRERPADLSAWLASLGGRWVLIDLTPGRERIHLDSSGCSPVVFDPSRERASSSLGLIAEPPPIGPGSEVHTLLVERKRFFPFGLTPTDGVRRVLPNHTLDLTSWRAERSWTPERDEDGSPPWRRTRSSDVSALVATIADTMKRTASALAAEGCLVGTITAGRDSRAVLACLRGVLDRTTFFTISASSGIQELDGRLGAEIARALRLAHQVLPMRTGDDAAMAAYLHLTGYGAGGTILRSHPSGEGVGGDCFRLSGLAGEVARGLWWRISDRAATRFSAADLLERMRLPVREDFLAAADEWMAGLPDLDAFTLLDLLYIENLLGVWGSAQALHAAAHSRGPIWIMSHRRTFDAMARLPPLYRRHGDLSRDICRREWPELARFPINRERGIGPAAREVRHRLVLRVRGGSG